MIFAVEMVRFNKLMYTWATSSPKTVQRINSKECIFGRIGRQTFKRSNWRFANSCLDIWKCSITQTTTKREKWCSTKVSRVLPFKDMSINGGKSDSDLTLSLPTTKKYICYSCSLFTYTYTALYPRKCQRSSLDPLRICTIRKQEMSNMYQYNSKCFQTSCCLYPCKQVILVSRKTQRYSILLQHFVYSSNISHPKDVCEYQLPEWQHQLPLPLAERACY